ncbi:hypothetical protein [Veronia pacifica]|uniref:EF-hand domain-containing protein n=1 Tax=Veronia pacifica TaxID=1080227 RepID=A0A1C3ED96_9GAMM|nr:hypothetical protein [Veronia pacifica]ODA31222.1 hypothetical protein A8L45_17835 [Veronia pacifica]
MAIVFTPVNVNPQFMAARTGGIPLTAMPIQPAMHAQTAINPAVQFGASPAGNSYYMARMLAGQGQPGLMQPAVMPDIGFGIPNMRTLPFYPSIPFPRAGFQQGFGMPGQGLSFAPPMSFVGGGMGQLPISGFGMPNMRMPMLAMPVMGNFGGMGGGAGYSGPAPDGMGPQGLSYRPRGGRSFTGYQGPNYANIRPDLRNSRGDNFFANNINFINPTQIKGEEKNGWICPHGGYKKEKNGDFTITKGKWAGHKCCWLKDKNCFNVVCCKSGESKGCWHPPKGGHKDKIASPLTFDLNKNGTVDTTGIGKKFDINGDGKVDNTAWAGKGDGVLAFDADGDGKVGTNGKELLGNYTDVDGDGKSDGLANGFEALKALAAKHLGPQAIADGKLDAKELEQLSQVTGLTMMVDGEAKSLAELGITEINLGYNENGQANADANGNEHRQQGAFVMNGQEQAVNDVWFRYQDQEQAAAPGPVVQP